MFTQINSLVSLINNQVFYGEPVGVYLIELEDQIILFDLPTYSSELEHFFKEKKKPIKALLSHGSGGIEDGTTWQEKVKMKVYLHRSDQNHPWLRMKPNVFFIDPPKLASNLEVISTPGHSPGSVCLLETSTRVLFTGDTFGGTADGKVRDFRGETRDDIPARLTSCQLLLDYSFDHVLPFHYHMIMNQGKTQLQKYIEKTQAK